MVLVSLLLFAAAVFAGSWFLRPVPGASAWTDRSLCGPVGAGSSDDGVEEPFSTHSTGESISLEFQNVTFYGRFSGTLREGRFGGGVPISGWLRARGFTASYRTGAGARGEVQGALTGKILQGSCTERFTESLAGEPRIMTTAFSFRLEPCDK